MKEVSTREIERQLRTVRHRIRRVQIWRGGLLVGSLFLAGLFLSMILDWIFAPLAPWVRWLVFTTWLSSLAVAFWRGFRPCFQKLDFVRIARWLEGRHPEMQERLSTALEVSRRESASSGLIANLVAAAEEDVLLVDANREVRLGRATRKRRWAVGGAFALLIFTLVIFPQTTGRLLVRSVVPFSEAGNVGASVLELIPGDLEVMEGGAVEIELFHNGHIAPEILLDFESGGEIAQPFRREGGRWYYRLEPVSETFRYRARAERAVSDQFLATVLPLPELQGTTVEREFPNYTGKFPDEELLGEVVEGVVGTRIVLSGQLNTGLASAILSLPDGREVGARLEPSRSGERVRVEFDLAARLQGQAVLTGSHHLGGEVSLARFQVLAESDEAPRVKRVSPSEGELEVRPGESVSLNYLVLEDYGIGGIVLEAKNADGKMIGIEQNLFREGRQQPRKFEGTTEFLVTDLMERLSGTREFQVRVAARDNLPMEFDGPGWGYSGWLNIKVNQKAKSLVQQELASQHEDTRTAVEEVIRNTREAERKMREGWQHLVEERKNQKSAGIVREAREKLARTGSELATLAKEMKRGIHAAKTPAVERAQEKLEEALENFEKVSLWDKREERVRELENALEKAREAIQILEELGNEINRDRTKVDDLVRLEDLAWKQGQLARQAEKQKRNPVVGEKWQKKQQEVAREVKNQVRQRPEALAEALREQSEVSKKLGRQADDLARSQVELGVMVPTAGDDLNSREQQESGMPNLLMQISKRLQAEQMAIAQVANEKLVEAREEGSPTAGELARVASQAQDARDAFSDANFHEAMNKADGAAQALQGMARESSALGKLTERQERVAAAAKAVNKENVGEAVAKLQEMAEAQVRDLVEDIEAVSRLEGSSMNQAGRETRRGQQQSRLAIREAEQGRMEQSARKHGQAAKALEQASRSLAQASKQLQSRAGQLSGQTPPGHHAPAAPVRMVQGLQAVEQAARAHFAAEAAQKARQAAEVLSAAAQESRQKMKGISQGSKSAQQNSPDSSREGEEADENVELQVAGADQGVPPELAKLGISKEDWAQIKASLQKDVGVQGGVDVPEDYQGLVKDYFQTMSEQ